MRLHYSNEVFDNCLLEWLFNILLLGRSSMIVFWAIPIGGIFLSPFFQAFGSFSQVLHCRVTICFTVILITWASS